MLAILFGLTMLAGVTLVVLGHAGRDVRTVRRIHLVLGACTIIAAFVWGRVVVVASLVVVASFGVVLSRTRRAGPRTAVLAVHVVLAVASILLTAYLSIERP